MVEYRPGHGLGLLYVREVGGAGDHLEARAGDGVADELAVLWRGRRIIGCGDDEGRGPDLPEPVSEVHVPDRRAAPGVAFGVRPAQHRCRLLYGLGVRGEELRGEPAYDDAVYQCVHTLFPCDPDALVPELSWAEQGRGAAEDEALDALHPQPVEQRQGITPEVLDGVQAGGNGRASVPAVVVAQQPEPLAQRGRPFVPHTQRRAQGVSHDEHGRLLGTLEQVMELDGGSLCHTRTSLPYRVRARSTNAPAEPR